MWFSFCWPSHAHLLWSLSARSNQPVDSLCLTAVVHEQERKDKKKNIIIVHLSLFSCTLNQTLVTPPPKKQKKNVRHANNCRNISVTVSSFHSSCLPNWNVTAAVKSLGFPMSACINKQGN